MSPLNFVVNFWIRQVKCLVLSPFLFAIYLGDICKLYMGQHSHFIVVYADDIMLISPCIAKIERLLHASENEFNFLDMAINFKNFVMCILMLVMMLPVYLLIV